MFNNLVYKLVNFLFYDIMEKYKIIVYNLIHHYTIKYAVDKDLIKVHQYLLHFRTYTEDLIHELGTATLVLCILCVLIAWYFPKIREVSTYKIYIYPATIWLHEV